MKFSFPTKAEFCETVKTAPQKIGYTASKELKALNSDPLSYATNCSIRYGRGVAGLLWMWGDASLYASSHETLLARVAGYVCAPTTLAFILEPMLGKTFGKNSKQQPVVPIGPYKINTTKLGYKGFAVATTLLFTDGLMHTDPQIVTDLAHGVQAVLSGANVTLAEKIHAFKDVFSLDTEKSAAGILQSVASAFASYGSLQAGWKEKGDLDVVTQEQEKPKPEGSILEQIKNNNEVQGVGKLLMENGFMITSAVMLGRPEMLMAYLKWTVGNVVLVGRSVLEIFKDNKEYQKQKPTAPMPQDGLKV